MVIFDLFHRNFQFHLVETVGQIAENLLSFQAGQCCTKTVVDAATKGDVLVRGSARYRSRRRGQIPWDHGWRRV